MSWREQMALVAIDGHAGLGMREKREGREEEGARVAALRVQGGGDNQCGCRLGVGVRH